ncbi:hypothetical protein CLU79DRAFT_840887 [Phycomyces nitens]|nr:hypothetical protein CLU79DRAFT_840887 [Phycomyces nitens]
MSQALIALLRSQLSALQITDNTKPDESGAGPVPMDIDVLPLASFKEASLPPKKRASYRVVSSKRPCSINDSIEF